MNYQPISRKEFRDRVINGQDITGYEIDWIVQLDFTEMKFAYHTQLRFSNCIFKYGININDIKSTEDFFNLKFDRCVFESTGLTIRFADVTTIELKNCVSTVIHISESKSQRIEIENTKCTESCGLYQIECKRFSLTQKKELLFKSVLLDAPKLQLAMIRGVHKIERVLIKKVEEVWLRGKIGTLDLEKDFKRIEIFDVWDESKKKLVNSSIKNFTFDFETFHGDILVRDTHIENLKFEELNAPTAKVQFKEVTIENTKILDCSIPNMIWNQLEFTHPPELVGTDFSGLKMSNVKWGKGYPLANSFLDEKIPLLYFSRKAKIEKVDKQGAYEILSELKYQRDTYRQLKAAALANHNTIESLEFYKNEMILYWKEIRLAGGVAWHDRILVFVNRFSSNFGQNWWMPLCWMFAFALIFYSGILNWDYFGNAWTGSEEFGQFWILFNPVHSTPKYINSGMGHFTEFIMRVVTGYFLYHFIRASRKFGRG